MNFPKHIAASGRWLTGLLASLLLLTTACETEFTNPNSPTDAQILNSREGLIALSVGVKQLYSTSGVRWLVETPAITTREGGITTTFQNMIELEDGGSELPNFNSNVAGLWSTMLRVVVSCNDLIAGVDNVDLSPSLQSSILAFANAMKGMAIGALAQHYEQVVVDPSINNDAAFVARDQGYQFAIRFLENATTALGGSAVDPDFQATVLGGMDLANSVLAMQARFNLYAGNYEPAMDAALAVDQSVASVFDYDLLNPNPIWGRIIQNNAPNFKPRDNFGLPAEFVIPDADGRKTFYLIPLDETNQNGLPIEDIAGFFQTDVEPIPVYLPDEMLLILAEAELRLNSDTDAALGYINEVRNDTDDVFGVNADIGDYEGDETVDALLREVFLQRRLELFLTGQSLEDSRRFNRPEPSTAVRVFTDERNRNFYPYPERERNNNPNTPADPTI